MELNYSEDPSKAGTAYLPDYESERSVLTDGSLKFTAEEGGNTSKPTYQEVSGAPVESNSPLGYFAGWVTIVFLNLNKMVGTGIFSTRMMHLSKSLSHKLKLTCFSIDHLEGNGLSWPCFVLLGYWVFHCSKLLECILGIRLVLSQPLWFRGGLPRTSLPSSKIFLPYGFCSSDSTPLFQQQQCNR